MPTGHWNFPTPKPWCCRKHHVVADPLVNPRRKNSTNQGHLLVFWDAFFCTFDLQKSLYCSDWWFTWPVADTGTHIGLRDTWDAIWIIIVSDWNWLILMGWSCNFPMKTGVRKVLPRRSSLALAILLVQYRHRPAKEKGACYKGHAVILIYVWDGWKKVKSKIITKTTNSRR